MIPVICQCDVCTQVIPEDKPRVHCLTCSNYDLCADCALGGKANGDHNPAHPTQIYSISGGRQTIPCVSDGLSLTYATPAAPSPAVSSRSPPPLPNRNSVPPPLPPRTSSGSNSSRRPLSAGGPAPSYDSSPPRPRAAPPPPPGQWGFLFDYMDDSGGRDVTPLGEMVFEAIFSYLDTSRSGYLAPEAYSRFLDDQGYQGQENVWRNNLKPDMVYGQSKESVADKSLKNAYDLFSIEHILKDRPRAPGPPNPSISSQMFSLFGVTPTPLTGSVAGSKMPLLTLKGFMDITAVELLADPSTGWGNLSRVLKKYQLPALRGYSDLPRSVLPEYPDERTVDRVARLTAFQQRKDQEMLAAAMVQAELQRQGQQAAVDLVSDYRYVRTYY